MPCEVDRPQPNASSRPAAATPAQIVSRGIPQKSRCPAAPAGKSRNNRDVRERRQGLQSRGRWLCRHGGGAKRAGNLDSRMSMAERAIYKMGLGFLEIYRQPPRAECLQIHDMTNKGHVPNSTHTQSNVWLFSYAPLALAHVFHGHPMMKCPQQRWGFRTEWVKLGEKERF